MQKNIQGGLLCVYVFVCVCVYMLLWIINPLVVITQQLLSRAETLTTLMKDGDLFSIYNTEAAVCQSQRCVNANWGEADGNTGHWEYEEMGNAADGKPVQNDPLLTGLLDKVKAGSKCS